MWDRKHFLTIEQLDRQDIEGLISRALDLKQLHHGGKLQKPLSGKSMAMIFRKPSLRTRMSFEMAMVGLGGYAFYVSDEEIKLGQREAICDVARVVSRYVDIVMIRTFAHQEVEEFARFANVPVINGLTDLYHPCQVLGDIMTVIERKGRIEGLKIVFIGDANNVANSWINASARLRFDFVMALAREYQPDPQILSRARNQGASIKIFFDPMEAARDADVLYTDVWVSMGVTTEIEKRKQTMKHLQINRKVLEVAKPDVIVMHCLPAHRGEEITDDVIDGEQSVVYDEAENRMHIQRAIILELLGK